MTTYRTADGSRQRRHHRVVATGNVPPIRRTKIFGQRSGGGRFGIISIRGHSARLPSFEPTTLQLLAGAHTCRFFLGGLACPWYLWRGCRRPGDARNRDRDARQNLDLRRCHHGRRSGFRRRRCGGRRRRRLGRCGSRVLRNTTGLTVDLLPGVGNFSLSVPSRAPSIVSFQMSEGRPEP